LRPDEFPWTEKAKDKKDAKKQNTKDDPKAGADVGKIVNLMAVDANRVRIPFVFRLQGY